MDFFLTEIHKNLAKYSANTAFVIDEISYSYKQLSEQIAAVQLLIEAYDEEQYFGVVTRNSLQTYATIYALWFMGKTFVPISPKTPIKRNVGILNEVEIKILFDANENPLEFDGRNTISTAKLPLDQTGVKYVVVNWETDLYMLFTSGSTGKPKGVRLSQGNLNEFLKAFFDCGYDIQPKDRCTQVYELTFDASVQCYTFPLLKGASIYTIPEEGVRFLSILKVLQQHRITWVKMTPSVIYYLQPYFDRINLPDIRYCLFGGEAFPADLVSKWEKSVSNAEIHNVYGPTEATINCTFYKWKKGGVNKIRNGIASIGKSFSKVTAMVCDANLVPVDIGTIGELCVSGPLITKGYWKRPDQNEKSFFIKENIRYYRTGDLVIMDDDGDILYIGRKDAQVQIDGHRIELGEIENHASKYTKAKCIAMVVEDQKLTKQIVLFVESLLHKEENIQVFLRERIPEYMMPGIIHTIEQIPLLPSGKTDRQSLIKMIDNA